MDQGASTARFSASSPGKLARAAPKAPSRGALQARQRCGCGARRGSKPNGARKIDVSSLTVSGGGEVVSPGLGH